MRRFHHLALFMIIQLGVTACAVKLPFVHYYKLNALSYHSGKLQQTSHSLLITEPEAAAGFNTQKIAYSQQLPNLNYYAYHQWVASPSAMLNAILVSKLSASHAYRAVLTAPTTAKTDWQLDTHILQFYQALAPAHSTKNRFIIQIKADLIRESDNHILKSQVFSCQQTSHDHSLLATAKAANIALNRCVDNIVETVTQH